jgi:FHS family L-fucose permease-like MFS transporter
MLVGRSASSIISGKVATRTQLIVVSATAIFFILIAIFTPKEITVSMPGYSVENGFEMASVPVSALFLVLCGLCTSIMWGGIFNLAVEGLGKYTAQASGIFMMMVVGGGIFPLLQQFISDAVGYMASYWLIIALLAYLLFYGLIGCKNVNKDIPVE